MVTVVISAAASLVAGLLLGGCAGGNDGISKSLLTRTAELEKQLTGAQWTLTGLAVALVITAAGLGASIYVNTKGGKRGKETGRTGAGK